MILRMACRQIHGAIQAMGSGIAGTHFFKSALVAKRQSSDRAQPPAGRIMTPRQQGPLSRRHRIFNGHDGHVPPE